MSSFSLRRLFTTMFCVGSLVTLTAGMSGCTDDDPECTTRSDCNFGKVCENNKCVNEFFECIPDDKADTCGEGRYCSPDLFECVPGCGADVECGDGQVCRNNRCQQRPDCSRDEDCGVGKFCNAQSVCEDKGLQCRNVLDVCEPGSPTRQGFICTNLGTGDGPRCYNRCEERDVCSPALNQNTGEPILQYSLERVCPAGSFCINGSACAPSQCDGPVKGKAQCDALFPETGGNCVQKTSGNTQYPEVFYVCEAAGMVEDGQPCGGGGAIGGGMACRAGRTCVNRVGLFNLSGGQGPSPFCAKACDSDLECGVNERCVGDDEGTFGGAGICTERCEPFNLDIDQCSEGKKCFPVSSEDGICIDLIPPGPKAAYDACSGDDVCPSGTLCVAGTCSPQCDPTLPSQDERDATCQGGNPKAYVKVLHLAQGAGPVDVYVDGTRILDDFAFDAIGEGENGRFLVLDPGEHVVTLYAGTDEDRASVLTSQTLMVEGNKAYYISALLADNPTSVVQLVAFNDDRVVAEPAEQQAILRVVHNVEGAGNVDVVATAANADVSVEANQVVLVENFAFGSATGYTNLDAGSYDIYIFPAGSARSNITASAAFTGVTVEAGVRGSAIAYGNLGQNNTRTPGLKVVPHKAYTFIPRSGGYCFNLAPGNGQDTTPSWGVCFQKCEGGIADYGSGACDGDGFPACQPFGTNLSVCFEKGEAKLGEACQDDGCEDGLFCDLKGDGTGTCRSYCTLGNVTNPNLAGCDAAKGEQCMPSDRINGLGECRLPCTPDTPGSFTSASCPEGQKTCRPTNGNYYCHPSGDVAVGTECAGGDADLTLDCAPGAMCVRNVLVPDNGFTRWLEAHFGTDPGETATCRNVCRPFLPEGETDCPQGFACAPIMPFQDIVVDAGVCVESTTVNEDDSCEEVSKMCGDGAICTTATTEPNATTGLCEQSGSCLRLCDPTTKLGCPSGQRCRELGSQDNRSLVFGVYGICRE